MRITQWGEYGIHFSVMIAKEERAGRVPVGAETIAQAQGIDLHYAQQILQRLRKNGIAASIRGPQGGYKLARPAEEITLLDVIVAAEGNSFELMCDSKPINHELCTDKLSCPLSNMWRELKGLIDDFLANQRLDKFAETFEDYQASKPGLTRLPKSSVCAEKERTLVS